jgi:transposase
MNRINTLAAERNIANIITVIGVDLAKNVFALHGVNAAGKPILVRPHVRRDQLLDLLAQLPPCTIGMEACTGAHHWARALVKFGHTPRLMAPKFVAPYRMQGKRGKNDANDAAAICEAATRPHMRFVPVKSEDDQATLTVHRVRQGFIGERTASINRVRGLLSEFGVVLAQKADTVRRAAHLALEHLPAWANRALTDLLGHIATLDQRIDEYDVHLRQLARADERGGRLMQIPGVGSTTATALLATIGNGHDFKNGRQLAAWLGLVPGRYGSGGVTRLGRITKAGDRYIRTLLILGARSVLATASNKQDRISRWALALQARIGYGKTLVAIAAKNARMIWAMLARAEAFEPPASTAVSYSTRATAAGRTCRPTG